MFKAAILGLILILASARTYPMYKQCDSQWGSEQMGNGGETICAYGSMLSSIAMGLAGTGHNYNPGTLNTWLKANGGYDGGIIPSKINQLGLSFEGTVSTGDIKSMLDQGKVMVINVHDGRIFVLAYGYSGDNILVNDPLYSTTSYPISQIQHGNTHVWSVAKK
jgi:hypothetical protein